MASGVYVHLNDYGIIGNQFGAALISRFGSIEWCCLPYLDSVSHFAALLDQDHGGRFQIAPQGEFNSKQEYSYNAPILETQFRTPEGSATLTDWMSKDSTPIIYRRIKMKEGSANWVLNCTPHFGYGTHLAQAEMHRSGGVMFRGVRAGESAHLQSEIPLEISSDGVSVSAKFKLTAGQEVSFAWIWGRQQGSLLTSTLSEQVERTIEAWQQEVHVCSHATCPFVGPWHDLVVRSGWVLKLLSTGYAGSIAEAIISVPSPGGLPAGSGWGWNHRHAWIRNGATWMETLANTGAVKEARAYFSWLNDILIRDGAEGLQSVYALDGGKVLPEDEILGNLDARRGSSLQAGRQFQLDPYGQVLLTAAKQYELFGHLSQATWSKLTDIIDVVCQAWRRPDFSPWETHFSRPEHYLSSKLLCWVALDRGCKLSEARGLRLPTRWKEERSILHRTLCEQGFNSKLQSFIRFFGSQEVDSSALLIPLMGLIPWDDLRVISTFQTIQERLGQGIFVFQSEQPSLFFTLLTISYLALSGRTDEASDRLAEFCTYASPLGLFGDQIDLSTGALSGHFPSALVHSALIQAALHVGIARGKQSCWTPFQQTNPSATEEAA